MPRILPLSSDCEYQTTQYSATLTTLHYMEPYTPRIVALWFLTLIASYIAPDPMIPTTASTEANVLHMGPKVPESLLYSLGDVSAPAYTSERSVRSYPAMFPDLLNSRAPRAYLLQSSNFQNQSYSGPFGTQGNQGLISGRRAFLPSDLAAVDFRGATYQNVGHTRLVWGEGGLQKGFASTIEEGHRPRMKDLLFPEASGTMMVHA